MSYNLNHRVDARDAFDAEYDDQLRRRSFSIFCLIAETRRRRARYDAEHRNPTHSRRFYHYYHAETLAANNGPIPIYRPRDPHNDYHDDLRLLNTNIDALDPAHRPKDPDVEPRTVINAPRPVSRPRTSTTTSARVDLLAAEEVSTDDEVLRLARDILKKRSEQRLAESRAPSSEAHRRVFSNKVQSQTTAATATGGKQTSATAPVPARSRSRSKSRSRHSAPAGPRDVNVTLTMEEAARKGGMCYAPLKTKHVSG